MSVVGCEGRGHDRWLVIASIWVGVPPWALCWDLEGVIRAEEGSLRTSWGNGVLRSGTARNGKRAGGRKR